MKLVDNRVIFEAVSSKTALRIVVILYWFDIYFKFRMRDISRYSHLNQEKSTNALAEEVRTDC